MQTDILAEAFQLTNAFFANIRTRLTRPVAVILIIVGIIGVAIASTAYIGTSATTFTNSNPQSSVVLQTINFTRSYTTTVAAANSATSTITTVVPSYSDVTRSFNATAFSTDVTTITQTRSDVQDYASTVYFLTSETSYLYITNVQVTTTTSLYDEYCNEWFNDFHHPDGPYDLYC